MKLVKFGKKQIKTDAGNVQTEYGEVKNGWYGATPPAYAFAKANIPEGSDIEIIVKANHNPAWNPVINKINKVGGGSAPVTSLATSAPSSAPAPVASSPEEGIKVKVWRDDKRVEVEEDGKLFVYNCSDAVHSYGSKCVPVGSFVTLDITDGTVVKINKKVVEPQQKTAVAQGYTPYNTGEFMKPRTIDERSEMMAESIAKTTAETVKVLEGQIDINGLPEAIKKIFDVYYKLITDTSKKLKDEFFK